MSDEIPASQLTRRGFLSTVSVGAVGVATLGHASAGVAPAAETAASELLRVVLKVNGREHRLLVEPRWTLLFVLRERLGLTGTKVGCERGECGACTVLVDGVPRYACMTLAAEAQGHEITTVEGLMDGEQLGPVQKAFAEHDAFQCGYCTSGQVVAAEGLLRAKPAPSRDEVRLGMSGNICRCGAYAHIVKAVEMAAELRRGGGR
ncbi:MAG TPA: (2Fe-2S)-binding protein [Thermoanaerobaculaceae bacterium]|nr:(2Fe-2S)-binding protein [Thermoanaerobaculaceae bacterium]HPS80142.1 (2Fe-2S)-binding protein [Thermoanaerobaculaceae bacterium]